MDADSPPGQALHARRHDYDDRPANAAIDALSTFALSNAEIYGRDEEIDVVRAIVEGRRGLPAVVQIRGEAGAGKTTIWTAAVDAARGRGYVVLESRPAGSEANLSFAGLRDMLDSHFDELVEVLPDPQAQALAVALLRRQAGRPERPGTVEAGFLRCLQRLAERSPVLVAIDDLQWLDRPTRRAVEFAARRLGAARVAVIATERTESGSDSADLARAISPAKVTAIELGPLSLGAIHALLQERTGATFPRPLLRRIHDASRGNPFMALEIALRLRDRGTALRATEDLPLPDDVRQLIDHRLAPLPARVRDALLIAAALSSPTDLQVRAAGGAHLRAAEAAGIVRLQGGRVRFAHPLFASSVYAAASPEQRRKVHHRLASVAPSIEERARHRALAAPGPEESVAAELERAAADAFDRGAVDAAIELIARACDHTPMAGAADLHRRRMLQAEYSMKAGDTGRAREVADLALAAAPAGTPRAEALFYRGRAEMFGADWELAETLFERAASEPEAAPAMRARIQLAFGQLRTMTWRSPRDGLERARSAARLAEASGRDDILCEALCLQAKHQVLLGEGDPEPLLHRAETLAPAMAGLWVAQRPLDFVAGIREWQDDIPAARSGWEEICRLSEEHGDDSSREWTLWRLAHAECLAGAWAAALRNLEEGRALALQAGRSDNDTIYLGMLSLLEAHLGEEPAARDHAALASAGQAAGGIAIPSVLAGRAIGLLELSLGRLAEAHRSLTPLVEAFRASGIVEPGAMRFVADDIEALIGLGRVDEAERLLADLEARATRLDRPSARAAALRCRGLFFAEAGAADAAVVALRYSLAQHDGVSMPFERARTLLILGRVARRSKERGLAREALAEAARVFDNLGASIWATTARQELARVPGRRPARGELTPTEARVAELLADGRSTAEVAAALFVTPKSVETYASRIYAKLGVHSRAALVARIAGRPAAKL